MVDSRCGKGIGGHLGAASAAESIPIPPKPLLQPRLQPPPQVIEAWSKWARSVASQQTATAPASPKKPMITTLPVRPVNTGAGAAAGRATPGERVFVDAFKAWNQDADSGPLSGTH